MVKDRDELGDNSPCMNPIKDLYNRGSGPYISIITIKNIPQSAHYYQRSKVEGHAEFTLL